jgi:hypothetical protein
MKRYVDPHSFSVVCYSLQTSGAKTAILFLDKRCVVRATWRFKPSSRNTREEIVIKMGEPNFWEREFLSKLKVGKKPIPDTVILRPYPKKKASKK